MPEFAMPTLALLAGGLATRMHPQTLWTAKSMLPVAGEPFLGYQLRLLAGQGIREIVICCGHFEEQLRGYVGDGSRWGCRVRYSPDGPSPLGTGGAIRKALPLLGDRFLVMYGDSYLRAPFAPVWQAFLASGAQGLMSVYRNAGRWDTSNVEVADGRIRAYNKKCQTPEMRYIDYGPKPLSRGRRAAASILPMLRWTCWRAESLLPAKCVSAFTKLVPRRGCLSSKPCLGRKRAYDHRENTAAHLAGRGRHRFAFLLPRVRRVRHLGRDQ